MSAVALVAVVAAVAAAAVGYAMRWQSAANLRPPPQSPMPQRQPPPHPKIILTSLHTHDQRTLMQRLLNALRRLLTAFLAFRCSSSAAVLSIAY